MTILFITKWSSFLIKCFLPWLQFKITEKYRNPAQNLQKIHLKENYYNQLKEQKEKNLKWINKRNYERIQIYTDIDDCNE